MSLFGSYLGQKTKDAHNMVVSAVVSFDPQGATEAQISEYVHSVDSMADIAARAEQQAVADEAKISQIQADLDKHIRAIDMYSSDPTKETVVTKLLSDAETLKADLKSAKDAATDSRKYADERKQVHGEAVTKLTSARANLERAMREQERAKQDAARAAERKRDTEAAAGITSGLNTMDVALDAMNANAAKMRRQAAADGMTAAALTHTTDDVEEALKAVDAPPKMSIAERLAALKN